MILTLLLNKPLTTNLLVIISGQAQTDVKAGRVQENSPHGISPTRRYADRRNAVLAILDKRKVEDSGRVAFRVKASIKQ